MSAQAWDDEVSESDRAVILQRLHDAVEAVNRAALRRRLVRASRSGLAARLGRR